MKVSVRTVHGLDSLLDCTRERTLRRIYDRHQIYVRCFRNIFGGRKKGACPTCSKPRASAMAEVVAAAVQRSAGYDDPTIRRIFFSFHSYKWKASMRIWSNCNVHFAIWLTVSRISAKLCEQITNYHIFYSKKCSRMWPKPSKCSIRSTTNLSNK